MKNLRGTYVHRGDVERFKRRMRATMMAIGLVTTAVMASQHWAPLDADAAPLPSLSSRPELRLLSARIAQVRTGFSPADHQLERWSSIFGYSRRYRVDDVLAAKVYDAAVATGIDPELAFPLVRIESGFIPTAVSPVGALGLTQLMLPTARAYERHVTREDLLTPEVNLRIGFSYLRDLIREHGSVPLALLVYNRGPAAVELDRELGVDPSNGYERVVLRSYRGTGLLD
ncbi:MAG: hypothetical protein MNPFHGCM_00665 [Gemmatimonadaceae bacterium]|nr:hypothetical protein [Gemmatimonadaceae bacterium]